MRLPRMLILGLSVLSLCSCSLFGKGGDTSNTESGVDGNIPGAEQGGDLRDVNFAYDSAALTPDGKGVLSANANWLMDNPSQKVVVEGHCDERGTVEYNLALGERRAQSVFDYLRGLGVKKEQLATQTYGEELPLDPRHVEDAWSKNRRAHFSVK